ncbi:RNA polymerase II degradation factor 1 isoform X2 [Agrilus planipennis]|uniref:RNA polymerase II degradation factor 1 isoform X2 n=1 Tax=Agrilus planipennis TaxID=224129 RepID=A0A7F5RFH6_AGRPL|nr:RNA polymerase II degradation factor 1 isoform X2 [Agrilus planipennis]
MVKSSPHYNGKFVIILLCDVVWGKREAESSHERYVPSTRQSRGQSPGSAPQQALTHESGQSFQYATEGPQAVNYAGSPHLVFRNPLTYSGSNSAASPNAEEQLQNYAFAASFEGKENVQAHKPVSYSPASDVSQFRYSSPLVKYSNLGVISQVTGDEALKSLQKSSVESSQQSRYPSQYLTQSQGYRSVPQESSESYASATAASAQAAQQPAHSSSAQQLQGEEPTTYEALLSQYYAQQQQQHQKQQAQQHQLQLQQQQQYQQFQESSALPQQYSKASQSSIPAHLLQQGNQVRSQYPAGLPARAKGTSASGGKSPGFAEQIAQFLGHFTLGSRGNSYPSPQAVASGPQKFNNEVISSQQRPISSDQLSKQQQQYYLQQSARQKQAYPGAIQAQQQQQQQQPLYQFVPAGYSAGQQQLQYSKYSQQGAAAQSPESQQAYAVSPQGGYIFGGHPNSVYATSPQTQGAASSQAAYTEGQRSAAAQVVYSNVAPQSEYSSSPSQTIQYVPAHRSAAGASSRSQLQSAASSHSAYA